MQALTADLNQLRKDLSEVLGDGDQNSIKEFIKKYTEGIDTKEEIRNTACTIVAILQDLCADSNSSYIKTMGDELLMWIKTSDFDSTSNLQSFLYNVISNASLSAGEEKTENRKYIKIADEIKKVIEEEYAAIENVEQITDKLGLSSRHANKIFKLVEDITIFDYLIKVRIQKAKELLEDPYLKIYEVAENVGYGSPAYFTAIFKRNVGVTPNDYRKKAQKNHIEI